MNVVLTMHHDRISWIISCDVSGYRATGADPLSTIPSGDYMVLLTNVVNRINNDYEVENWDFIRG